MKEKLLFILFIVIIFSGCSDENENQNISMQYNWEISEPQELNIDPDKIETAFIKGEELGFLNSIVIIRNGKIASEKYYRQYDKNSSYSVKSVSKSFLSASLGIAIDKGIIYQDDKLTEILDEYNSSINDQRFFDISIDHLIKMRSGLDTDLNIYSQVFNSSNWLSTIFQMTLINNPGVKFAYSTPGTHLLSAILTKASGLSSFDYITDNLLLEMGIEMDHWAQDPQGIYFGGNNMYFTTRNMAVLGLLYLNNGFLNDTQIVPKWWVEESLIDYSGGIGDWGVMKNIGYGYLWWLGEINNYKIFTAIGFAGQFVMCVPELDLIVATNAASNIGWEAANLQELAILDIIGNYIIPAINK